jgi:hypothetical protein
MVVYCTARAVFRKGSTPEGFDWDGYLNWRNLPHLTEVVTLDDILNTLTNCDGLDIFYDTSDVNQFGLLNSWEKACYFQKKLPHDFPNHPHAKVFVAPIWRHKTIGRVNSV